MYYKIKPKDTLNKIARKFNVPVDVILAFNKEIVNPSMIYVNQQLYIPNIEDVPADEITVVTTAGRDLVARARSAINKGIRYKLGSGGMKPEAALPASNKLCDCSGFVCWVLGVSRKSTIPFYTRYGGWIYTDSMVADVNSNAGIFEKINIPEAGSIVVYGAGDQIGHVGIVSKVSNGKMEKVIHCSSGNDRRFRDSIQETNPDVFNRAETVWGRYTG